MAKKINQSGMSAAVVDAHHRRINGVFDRAYDEHGWTPVVDRTPLDILLAKEVEFEAHPDGPDGVWSWPDDASDRLRLAALKREEAMEVAALARRDLVRWLAGGGLHPFRVVQRFYALCYEAYPDVVGPLNGEWLARILDQTRAAFHEVVAALFGRVSEERLGVSIKVGGQKAAGASAAYAESAARICPKRQINGTAGLGREARDGMAAMDGRRAAALVRARVREGKKMEMERDAREFERIVGRGNGGNGNR